MQKYCMFAFFVLVPSLNFLTAQVREEWVTRYNGPESKSESARRIAVDDKGNVYVTGSTDEGLSTDYLTIKYDPAGKEVWVARYNGPENRRDEARAIAVDAKGNVYITGQTETGDNVSPSYLTIKYDSAGKEVWVARYNGPGNGIALALALDAAGNVYVTGAGATIKYDPRGNEVWVANSGGVAIALDSAGNVHVTGSVYASGSSSSADYRTVKFDPQGNQVWLARYNSPNNGIDRVAALALDAAGNVYVAGESGGTDERFIGIGKFDYATVKYDPAGNQVWAARYNGPGGLTDSATALAVDAAGNVYVTGSAMINAVSSDYATIKYDSQGNQVWVARYDGPGDASDQARAIALDAAGNVYVTGYSYQDARNQDYATIKYDPVGNEVWLARYNGPANGSDGASSLAIDATGNVYVTGASEQEQYTYLRDYATIKYSQSSASTFVTSLFFPRLVTDPGQSIGIAIVNLGTPAATLRFTAFERTGSTVSGSNITNPATRTLNASSQIPIIDAQVFGDGLTTTRAVGWFKVESTVRRIAGFFLMLDPALTVLDGADVSSGTLTSFVFPEVEGGGDWFTQIHIANPNTSSAPISLELVQADGSVRARADRTIEANGAVADVLTDLFPGVTPESSDYIRVTASQGVVAFEFQGRSGRFVQGLNGQDTASGKRHLYCPQYVVGGPTWRSTLSVVNLDDTSGTVTFRFMGDDGTLISTRQLEIVPRGKLFIDDQSFFVSPESQRQGYVEITSSGPRLTGSVVFGDQAWTSFSTALPLVANLRHEMILGQVASAEASSPSWFTGLALLNTGPGSATATVEVFDENGTRVKSGDFYLPAGRRLSRLLTQYFPDLEGRDILKGYIRVTTNPWPVAAFVLFGTTDLSVLSAVPPQIVP